MKVSLVRATELAALQERISSAMTNLWELSSMLDPESEYGKGFTRAVELAASHLETE